VARRSFGSAESLSICICVDMRTLASAHSGSSAGHDTTVLLQFGDSRDTLAINLTHRPDLENRIERLASRLGMNGRGRKTAVIERAITALEEQAPRMSPEAIRASLAQFTHGAQIAAELADDPDLDHSKPLSEALQEVLYDEHGLPK